MSRLVKQGDQGAGRGPAYRSLKTLWVRLRTRTHLSAFPDLPRVQLAGPASARCPSAVQSDRSIRRARRGAGLVLRRKGHVRGHCVPTHAAPAGASSALTAGVTTAQAGGFCQTARRGPPCGIMATVAASPSAYRGRPEVGSSGTPGRRLGSIIDSAFGRISHVMGGCSMTGSPSIPACTSGVVPCRVTSGADHVVTPAAAPWSACRRSCWRSWSGASTPLCQDLERQDPD
jgi:hypothetical protein